MEIVPIPNPPSQIKKPIAEKIIRTVNLRDEANELLDQADSIFFDALGLRRIKELNPDYFGEADNKLFNVTLTQLNSRLDGSFHIPLAGKVIGELHRADVELTCCDDERVSKKIHLPGRFTRQYVDQEYGFPFLSSKNISQIYPVGLKYLSRVKHRSRIGDLILKENIILVTRSGTVGKVQICPRYFEHFTANEHILRLYPSKEINPGYIYTFLSSEYGEVLIKRYTYGSVVDEIDDTQLGMVPFPIPKDKSLIDKIGNLVLEANMKRNKAWISENEAIAQVEKLVPM